MAALEDASHMGQDHLTCLNGNLSLAMSHFLEGKKLFLFSERKLRKTNINYKSLRDLPSPVSPNPAGVTDQHARVINLPV